MTVEDELRAENASLRAALSPFARFCEWVEAVNELDRQADPTIKPHDDHACVTSLMAGGGSDYIWMKDLRAARAALTRKD